MTTAAEIQEKFNKGWGAFRRFLALHPLTCFYAALGAGVILGRLWGWTHWPFF